MAPEVDDKETERLPADSLIGMLWEWTLVRVILYVRLVEFMKGAFSLDNVDLDGRHNLSFFVKISELV